MTGLRPEESTPLVPVLARASDGKSVWVYTLDGRIRLEDPVYAGPPLKAGPFRKRRVNKIDVDEGLVVTVGFYDDVHVDPLPVITENDEAKRAAWWDEDSCQPRHAVALDGDDKTAAACAAKFDNTLENDRSIYPPSIGMVQKSIDKVLADVRAAGDEAIRRLGADLCKRINEAEHISTRRFPPVTRTDVRTTIEVHATVDQRDDLLALIADLARARDRAARIGGVAGMVSELDVLCERTRLYWHAAMASDDDEGKPDDYECSSDCECKT